MCMENHTHIFPVVTAYAHMRIEQTYIYIYIYYVHIYMNMYVAQIKHIQTCTDSVSYIYMLELTV